MGILDKLFGEKPQIETIEAPPCVHATLTARWDSVEDMGNEDRATSYICEACGESFTPGEMRTLRATEVDRLPIDV